VNWLHEHSSVARWDKGEGRPFSITITLFGTYSRVFPSFWRKLKPGGSGGNAHSMDYRGVLSEFMRPTHPKFYNTFFKLFPNLPLKRANYVEKKMDSGLKRETFRLKKKILA
jgi:hypothetical protein